MLCSYAWKVKLYFSWWYTENWQVNAGYFLQSWTAVKLIAIWSAMVLFNLPIPLLLLLVNFILSSRPLSATSLKLKCTAYWKSLVSHNLRTSTTLTGNRWLKWMPYEKCSNRAISMTSWSLGCRKSLRKWEFWSQDLNFFA